MRAPGKVFSEVTQMLCAVLVAPGVDENIWPGIFHPCGNGGHEDTRFR